VSCTLPLQPLPAPAVFFPHPVGHACSQLSLYGRGSLSPRLQLAILFRAGRRAGVWVVAGEKRFRRPAREGAGLANMEEPSPATLVLRTHDTLSLLLHLLDPRSVHCLLCTTKDTFSRLVDDAEWKALVIAAWPQVTASYPVAPKSWRALHVLRTSARAPERIAHYDECLHLAAQPIGGGDLMLQLAPYLLAINAAHWRLGYEACACCEEACRWITRFCRLLDGGGDGEEGVPPEEGPLWPAFLASVSTSEQSVASWFDGDDAAQVHGGTVRADVAGRVLRRCEDLRRAFRVRSSYEVIWSEVAAFNRVFSAVGATAAAAGETLGEAHEVSRAAPRHLLRFLPVTLESRNRLEGAVKSFDEYLLSLMQHEGCDIGTPSHFRPAAHPPPSLRRHWWWWPQRRVDPRGVCG
jgi:hypothetical protein